MHVAAAESTAIEQEWQFDTASFAAVERWLQAPPAHLRLVPLAQPPQILRDRYLDTARWDLHRAGYTARVRDDGHFTLTLKSLAPARAGLRVREEVSNALASGELTAAAHPDGGSASRLAGRVIGRAPLRELAIVRTHRQRFFLMRDGVQIGEVALDETQVLPAPSGGSPDAPAPTFRRVEVEAATPNDLEIAAVVATLQRDCRLEPARLTKFESACAAAALQPPAEPRPEPIGPGTPVAALALAHLRHQHRLMRWYEPGARLGTDPEELHQMRVATRRFRAALRVFAEDVTPALREFDAEIQWLANALGGVRDRDVQIERLDEWTANAGAIDAAALLPLRDRLVSLQESQRADLLTALDSDRADRLWRSLEDALAGEPPPSVSAAVAGRDRLRGFARRFRRHARGLSGSPRAEELHRLRIRGKRLRYALEFFTPVYGRDAARAVRRLKAVQDALGDHQDAAVAIADLRDMCGPLTDPLPAPTTFAMGEMAADYERQRHDAWRRSLRSVMRFDRAWKAFAGSLPAAQTTTARQERAHGRPGRRLPRLRRVWRRPRRASRDASGLGRAIDAHASADPRGT